MPKGSYSSENVHSDFRGTSTSTLNSVGSVRSNHTGLGGGGNSNNRQFSFKNREYSNVVVGYDSCKNLLLSKFFNTSILRDENSPAYENLCSGCGYGVFEARGELCNFCQYVLNGCTEDNDNTNIYENICDKCSQLYSGNECLICLETNKHKECENNDNIVKTSSKKKFKKRLIHSLFGSLKRVKSSSSSSVTPSQQIIENNNFKSPLSSRKLQIVHNVDGFDNVFSTNETFDLNRICQLKQESQQSKIKASTSDHHIYGKLRRREPSEKRFECVKQKSQSEDHLISGGGIENSIIAARSCVPSCQSFHCHGSISSLDYDNSGVNSLPYWQSVCEWMTSLRCETNDYYSFGSPDTVLSNPKSIPGNFSEFGASSFIIYPRPELLQNSTATINDHTQNKSCSLSDEISQLEFAQQMVNEFKRNLMEKPGPQQSMAYRQHMNTKRQGIHLKLDDIENKQQTAQGNYHCELDIGRSRNNNENNNKNNSVDLMVGDHQLQRNDSNDYFPLQSSAQAQALALAAGLNGDRHLTEHQSNKRCCIYEKDSDFVSDILQAYDTILQRESQRSSPTRSPSPSSSPLSSTFVCELEEVQLRNNFENSQVVDDDIVPESSTSDPNLVVVVSRSLRLPSLPQNLNLGQIAYDLVLSQSLNRVVISYEISLRSFLSAIQRSPRLSRLPCPKLKKIFKNFQVFLFTQKQIQVSSDFSARSLTTSEQQIPAIEYNYSQSQTNSRSISNKEPHPLHLPISNSLNSPKMTVPSDVSRKNANEEDKEESIYQPIWKFKTVGEVREADAYYATGCGNDHHDQFNLPRRCDSSNSLSLADGEPNCIEDDDEWEPDNEFTFTRKLEEARREEADAISVNTIQSSNGSTITGYASSVSTMTLASTTSSISCGRLTYHIFRNICIFYSPTDPKIRAVLYEYDRNRCASYFAQQMPPAVLPSASLLSSSLASPSVVSPKKSGRGGAIFYDTSAASSSFSYKSSVVVGDGNKFSKKSSESSGSSILADSVQAWKYLLLDVNYLEDEEDMIVSESEILKAQTIKEMDASPPRVGVLQRFKSISSSNLLDMPAEEDKKSIAEKMRNKFARGVFKLHPRSPKETKKLPSRRKEATASLYLEDGIKPKYPIFHAPLEFLEMNETSYPDVPRFVVDCIEYIEQIDCIQMDGLYRASGNKVSIDELKQKLTDSYIYDPKLIVADDIHTLTSLLKLFFRELGSPLIPHNTYKSFPETSKLKEPSGIEDIKNALKAMKNPNRETLKFLIKHLTTVAHYSSENRMPASNLAIVWGPCILGANQIEFDIGRMNTIAKVLIENYDQIFGENERLVN